MRSFILPLAALVASVLAVPVPAKNCVTSIQGNNVVEIYDVTVTSTVYVTAGSEPTSTYIPPPPPTTYAPPPPPPTTYAPKPSPAPVYEAPTYEPVYNAPVAVAPKPEVPSGLGGDDKACLETHNKFRANHGAPALKWSTELANFAKGANGGSCAMVHTGGPYGENLAKGYSDVTEAIQAWYDEKSQYTGGYSSGVGHFTQLVWKATTEIGCYKRSCGDGDLLVCEYRVPGNVVGNNNQYFKENVQA